MKYTIPFVIDPVTHIIKRSFDTDVVGQEMKTAKVLSIYKSAEIRNKIDTVSLLSALSKNTWTINV